MSTPQSPDEQDVSLTIFEQHEIRRVWHEGRWFFSVVDVITALTDRQSHEQARQAWQDLKRRIRSEGAAETVAKSHRLKLPAADGKLRLTDCADTETMLRIIQSIPSPKAEPFKLWLAMLGNERIEAIANPEQDYTEARKRVLQAYEAHGYSHDWALVRLRTLEIRVMITQAWQERGGEGFYALLTEILHRTTFDIGTQEHLALKGFEQGKGGKYKGELRDAMTIRELGLVAFAEAMALAEHEEHDSHGIHELKRDVMIAGETAASARKIVVQQTGQQIPSSTNAIPGSTGLWGTLPDADESSGG